MTKAGINNKQSAFRHWIKFGKNEGRTFNLIIHNIIRTSDSTKETTDEINNTMTNGAIITQIINSYKNLHDCEDIIVK